MPTPTKDQYIKSMEDLLDQLHWAFDLQQRLHASKVKDGLKIEIKITGFEEDEDNGVTLYEI